MNLINLEVNLFYSDLTHAFNHAKATKRKVGIFEVLFDSEYRNHLSLDTTITNRQDLEEWLLNKDNLLFKVKTEEDVMAVLEELKNEGVANFEETEDELEYGIQMGKLIKNLNELKPNESFIVDEYMDIITKTPLEQMKYVFDAKIFVIGVY